MIDIYRGGWQLTKVKGMMIFSAVCAAGALYWAWDLLNNYGLAPGDGGVLAPLWQRLAWALSVAALGLAFLAGMWVFGRRYATRIRYDEAADALHVGTLELLATRVTVVPTSDVEQSDYHHGQMEGSGVNAPWFMLHFKGGRRSLVVDAQGVFPDRDLAKRLLKMD
jgi:hypothetical protein